jgi:hypothetical protein
MPKLIRLTDQTDAVIEMAFDCPGCGHWHSFCVAGGKQVWTWNATRCHLFVRDGKIQFLPDCHHALAGQVVDLPDTS